MVTHIVRLFYAGIATHDEMQIDKSLASCSPTAYFVKTRKLVKVLFDTGKNRLLFFLWETRVSQFRERPPDNLIS
jgi:hypothetical protein